MKDRRVVLYVAAASTSHKPPVDGLPGAFCVSMAHLDAGKVLFQKIAGNLSAETQELRLECEAVARGLIWVRKFTAGVWPVEVFSQTVHMARYFDRHNRLGLSWVDKWQANGWMDSAGRPVHHADKLRLVHDGLKRHESARIEYVGDAPNADVGHYVTLLEACCEKVGVDLEGNPL